MKPREFIELFSKSKTLKRVREREREIKVRKNEDWD
jgi:hypothetical protein